MNVRAFALRAWRFAMSGGASLAAYYAVYIGLTELGAHYLISSTVGFFAYWIPNFLLHRFWTFKSTGRPRTQAAQHFALHVFNQGFNLAALYILVDHLEVQYIVAQACLSVILTIEVFVVSHKIFKV